MNERLKNWVLGVCFGLVILPLILKGIFSYFLDISLVEAWGIIALFLVLLEGYDIVKNDLYEEE